MIALSNSNFDAIKVEWADGTAEWLIVYAVELGFSRVIPGETNGS